MVQNKNKKLMHAAHALNSISDIAQNADEKIQPITHASLLFVFAIHQCVAAITTVIVCYYRS